MKNVIFGKCLIALCATASLALSQAQANERSAPGAVVDECSKELLLSYFPETFVDATLKKFDIPEDQWKAINSELASKNDSVIKIVEEKASTMDPNPLKDPSQRQAAVKLFRDTLFDVFYGVLKEHGVTDEQKAKSMLEDIQHQKAIRFAECMEKKMPKADQPEHATPAAEDKPSADLSMADSEHTQDVAPPAAPTGTDPAPKEPETKVEAKTDHETSIHPIVDDLDDNDDDLEPSEK